MRAVVFVFAALMLAACAAPAAKPGVKSVSGIVSDLRFSLTDDHGRPVHAADYRGKKVLVFFGYTHCPDVCPTTLARIAQAAQATRDRGRGIEVLFVSVDPERDTQSRLREYAGAFGPNFVGLSGPRSELEDLARRYRVSYSFGTPDAEGNYEVYHSSGVFAFDAAGKARYLIRPGDSLAAITAALDEM